MWKPSITPEDVILHSGILGMKWGHRNGPPYPLGEGQHSQAELNAMKKKARSEKKAAKKEKRQAKKEIKVQKKAAKAEANRQKILKTGSLKDIKKLKGNISNSEYAEVFKRLENEQKLDDFDKERKKNLAVKVKSAQSVVSDLDKGTDSALKLYNRGAAIYNELARRNHWQPQELPIINPGKGGDNKQNKKEDGD